MAVPDRFESNDLRRSLAAAGSVALHLVLLLIALLAGGQQEGMGSNEATPVTRLVMIEARDVDPAKGIDLTPLQPAVAAALPDETFAESEPPPLAAVADAEISDEPQVIPPEATVAMATDVPPVTEIVPPAVVLIATPEEIESLKERLTRAAEEQREAAQSLLEWQENGKQYSARLIRERARDGTALERVVAEVSASDHGKTMSTRILFKRLAFSQFAQVVDRWDPFVQMHDDVIVGRFHSNSRFNVLHDSRVGPKVTGRVTTSARSFDMYSSGRRRQSEIFPSGVETRAGRIDLPEAAQPFAWSAEDPNARVHRFTDDTRIRFFADGSYMWQTQGAPKAEYLNAPSKHPVFFIAAGNTTLYVRGIVAGNILAYSPSRIVIESSLVYAHDPRKSPDSPDFLGLVSDKYVEVAPPGVTGPGDLMVHAAIFAGRRFLVRDIDQPRTATLKIYGSLSAGSLSASEPRYATQMEYDPRFERQRPPGFPMTGRFEAEEWDGRWVPTQHQVADEAF